MYFQYNKLKKILGKPSKGSCGDLQSLRGRRAKFSNVFCNFYIFVSIFCWFCLEKIMMGSGKKYFVQNKCVWKVPLLFKCLLLRLILFILTAVGVWGCKALWFTLSIYSAHLWDCKLMYQADQGILQQSSLKMPQDLVTAWYF